MATDEESTMSPEPSEEIPDEDAWAYTPEHLRRIAQAQDDIRADRVIRMTEDELVQFIFEHTGERPTP
jgi:hypothetical protein